MHVSMNHVMSGAVDVVDCTINYFFTNVRKLNFFLHIPDVFKKRFNMEFESFDQRLGLTLKKHFMGIFVNRRFPVIICKQLCCLHCFVVSCLCLIHLLQSYW